MHQTFERKAIINQIKTTIMQEYMQQFQEELSITKREYEIAKLKMDMAKHITSFGVVMEVLNDKKEFFTHLNGNLIEKALVYLNGRGHIKDSIMNDIKWECNNEVNGDWSSLTLVKSKAFLSNLKRLNKALIKKQDIRL